MFILPEKVNENVADDIEYYDKNHEHHQTHGWIFFGAEIVAEWRRVFHVLFLSERVSSRRMKSIISLLSLPVILMMFSFFDKLDNPTDKR